MTNEQQTLNDRAKIKADFLERQKRIVTRTANRGIFEPIKCPRWLRRKDTP